ncbi:hypothetical protein [Gloeothece verrucosa]|uniref:Uncharacterized protein n=1 Tax=Gloeothece verrucosa (strain PCC 7822) TaxID=497965 RepID=E0UDH7_GLOV7|nr:hypothetical protein [Gloeothece verrucosa]ADN15290.1 hypothetical protein Cyan7822_3340 [Gloeothece verrucosa PCC 7822]
MMTITLNLSPEEEAQLRSFIASGDAISIRRLLAEAVAPTVETLLSESSEELSIDEFEAIADQLAEEVATYLGPNPPVLSDYALSRAGIYEDHP